MSGLSLWEKRNKNTTGIPLSREVYHASFVQTPPPPHAVALRRFPAQTPLPLSLSCGNSSTKTSHPSRTLLGCLRRFGLVFEVYAPERRTYAPFFERSLYGVWTDDPPHGGS